MRRRNYLKVVWLLALSPVGAPVIGFLLAALFGGCKPGNCVPPVIGDYFQIAAGAAFLMAMIPGLGALIVAIWAPAAIFVWIAAIYLTAISLLSNDRLRKKRNKDESMDYSSEGSISASTEKWRGGWRL